MRLVEASKIGEAVRPGKGRLASRQRRVDRDGPRDLLGENIASGVEAAMQSVRFPAEAAELRVGLGILITQISVRRLNFLSADVREVRCLLRILLRLAERFAYALSHAVHRDPAHRAGA